MRSIIIGLFAIVFLWEHFGQIYQIDHIPTFLIGNCTEPFQQLCRNIGGWVSRFSSYLYHMQLKRVVQTLWNLIMVIGEFSLAPVWSIKGYIEVAYQEYSSPYTIYTGTILLIIAFGTLLYKQRQRIPFIKDLSLERITIYLEDNIKWIFIPTALFCTVLVIYYINYIYPTLKLSQEQ